MIGLILLVASMTLIIGGSCCWARRPGLVAAGPTNDDLHGRRDLWLRAPRSVALFAGLIIIISGTITTTANDRPIRLLAFRFALWQIGLAWATPGWRRHKEPVWAAMALGVVLTLIAPDPRPGCPQCPSDARGTSTEVREASRREADASRPTPSQDRLGRAEAQAASERRS